MDLGARIRSFNNVVNLVEDRARLELAFEEWRKKQIPPARNSVQSFLVFLSVNDLLDNEKVHSFTKNQGE
jgi:hypothetical protein